jgi:hypothetical protein
VRKKEQRLRRWVSINEKYLRVLPIPALLPCFPIFLLKK